MDLALDVKLIALNCDLSVALLHYNHALLLKVADYICRAALLVDFVIVAEYLQVLTLAVEPTFNFENVEQCLSAELSSVRSQEQVV